MRRCQSLRTHCSSDSEVVKKKEAKKNIAQRWAGKGVKTLGSLERDEAALSNPDGLPASGSTQCSGVFLPPPSFPEPWHWGVWNGSTCCNRTCELLRVAKLLQQLLH